MNESSNFDFGRKRAWRKWEWNRIEELYYKDTPKKRKRDAVILYLVGPNDFDRKIAIQKGFSNNNIIAVDCCNDNIESVRRSKNLGIIGKLNDVIRAWGGREKIDIIVADFCCDFNKSIFAFIQDLVDLPCFNYNTVVSVNLSRGMPGSKSEMVFNDIEFMKRKTGSHRGKMIIALYAKLVNNYKLRFAALCGNEDIKDRTLIDFKKSVLHLYDHLLSRSFFYTYKSRSERMWMDSVVFQNTWCFSYQEKTSDKNIKRSVAAVKAVRTMKKAGIL